MEPLPTTAIAGITTGWHKMRVIDATTGEQISGVREVDTAAGTLSRNEIDGSGNLVIADGKVSVIDEQRAVRLEWLAPPAAVPPVEAGALAEDAAPEGSEA